MSWGFVNTTDDGVSAVIGAVLMFGIIIVAMSIYHATVVPQQFEAEEISHNQQLNGDMVELRNTIQEVGQKGVEGSVTVNYGSSYDTPALFNPPPMMTRIATLNPKNVTVKNFSVDGPSGDYWNNEQYTYQTKTISAQPDYYYYSNAPQTNITHQNVILSYDSGVMVPESLRYITGNKLTIYLVSGSFDKTLTGSNSISVTPVSTSTDYTYTDTLTVTFETNLPNETWNKVIQSDHVTNVKYMDDSVQVSFTNMSVRIVKVHIGDSGVESQSPTYITTNNQYPDDAAVAQVNDKYGNGVSGATVTIQETGDTYTTDGKGEATIPLGKYSQSEITAIINNGDTPQEKVTFYIGGGNGGGSSPTSVQIDSLVDNSKNTGGGAKVSYDVSYSASGGNGIQSVTSKLKYNGNVVDKVTKQYNGKTPISDTVTLQDNNGDWQGTYTIVVTATGVNGDTDTTSQQDTADGK